MVLDERTQICMKKEECPKACPANETWNECGSDCDETCDSSDDLICNMACVAKCECDPGFVRENGKCIPKDECPQKKCGKNEIFNHCGSDCEATCATANDDMAKS